jgi:chemotaxis response regulator CheB
MSGHSILTVGVSADGLKALKTTVSNLPSEFPAAVFIVTDMGPTFQIWLLTRQMKTARPLQTWRQRSKSPPAKPTRRRP